MIRIATALLLILLSSNVIAINGEQLLESCQKYVAPPGDEPHSAYQSGLCQGYMAGMLDTLVYEMHVNHKQSFGLCVPQEVSQNQAAKILIKYLKSHPEELHFTGVVSLEKAFKSAFPCN